MAPSLGIDVGGERKGFDLVLLDEARTVLETARHVSVAQLPGLIDAWRPDCVGIDSPPMWGAGRERVTETELRRHGLSFYQTPWLPEKQTNAFYLWMVHGFRAFEAARDCGYKLFDGAGGVQGCAFETFPNAIAAVLTGRNRPPEVRKETWRRGVLEAQGIDAAALRGPDQVDAALAALSGVLALSGCFCWKGEPSEGVMVLPCRLEDLLPSYKRSPTRQSATSPPAPSPSTERGNAKSLTPESFDPLYRREAW